MPLVAKEVDYDEMSRIWDKMWGALTDDEKAKVLEFDGFMQAAYEMTNQEPIEPAYAL